MRLFQWLPLVILYKMQNLLLRPFRNINCPHACREGNYIAHNLIKHAIHVIGLLAWIKDVPPHISIVIQTDFAFDSL